MAYYYGYLNYNNKLFCKKGQIKISNNIKKNVIIRI